MTMNVLHLEYSGNTGGIEKLCKDIGLNAGNDKHYFAFVHEGGVFYDEMKNAGLDVSCLKFENGDIIKLYRAVNEFVNEKEIDMIIIHHPAPLVWLSMLMYLSLPHKAKVLVYVHNVYCEITKHSCIRGIAYNRLLIKCDGVIAISKFVKNTVIEHVRIPDEKVKVIYNGVECPNYLNSPNGELSNPVRIIYVGRLIEQKGVQILLRAIATLKDNLVCEVKIVGDGPFRANLEDLSRKLDIDEYVEFCGNQSNVQDWLKKADVFVHPAIWQEGFGITIAEALSFGKICIASKRGAIPEIIEDENSGFLFEAANPVALADKITYVCKVMTAEQRQCVQKNAMMRAHQFSIEKLMNKLHEYLVSLKGK